MFIEDYLPNFYEAYSGGACESGNIYNTHAYYPHEHLEFFRAVRFYDRAEATRAEYFAIQSSTPFNHGHTLHEPQLESNEEFLVVRAKRRPVVLLNPHVEIDIAKLRTGSPVWRKRCLVAQIFSIHREGDTKQPKFPENFIDRVKELEFPHLAFLSAGGPLSTDSILRLDECQSVFTPHLEVTGYRLHQDWRELIESQMISFFTKKPQGAYEMYRRDILEQNAKASAK